MSEQICRFCHRYVQLAYYCENCGSSCCSDCLHEENFNHYICQDCNSNNIDISGTEKKKVCKNCGSENVNKVNQVIKSCPKCKSHQIINIYEKKEELEKRFLELIKKSRLYLEPLKGLQNKLYILQQKLKKARTPPFKCYHYPKMESDLFALFKLFQYVQNTLCEKLNVHFHQLHQNQEYFLDTYAQPNSNITIIESIFDNLVRSYESINEFIINNINTFDCSMESIHSNLQFIDTIVLHFNLYKKILNLAEKEKPVFAIYAKLANGMNTQERYKKDKGMLFITNYDLSFIHERGVIKKKKELIFKAPVGDLTRIREKGKIFKKLYIEFAYGKYEFSLPSKTISRVIEYILLARNFDETTIYDKKTGSKLQEIDINLGNLETFIEESINSFFSIKCQYNKSNEKTQNYKQTDVSQNMNLRPNHFQNIPSWPKEQFNPNYNNLNYSRSGGFYSGNDFPSPHQFPGNYNSGTQNQVYPSGYNENSFFMQNFNNPNRLQNYNPRGFPRNNPDISNLDNRNTMMRRLIQNQRSQNSFDNPYNNRINNEFNEKPIFSQEETRYQDYNKNHLTNFFDSNYQSTQHPQTYNRKLSELNREKQEKMLELNKENYSLKQTLKKLEAKFDQGIISEVDYFKTFQNLQKKIYLIENNLQSLKESLEDFDDIKQNSRNFDKKAFY